MSAIPTISKSPEFDELWDYNDPSETEKKFKAILTEVKGSGNVSSYLQLLTQISRTHSLRMNFEEANKILDEVEPKINSDKIAGIRYYLERGRTYNSSKQKEKAKDLFLKAYDSALKSGEDFYTIDAAHMMGIVEQAEKSLKWNEIAIMHAEETTNERARGWLGSLYNNTAWTYHDMSNFEKALEIFEKNVKWHSERNTGQKLRIAKWSVGRTLRSLNRIDEALKIHNDLLDESLNDGIEKDGYVYEELGECNLIKGNKNEATKYFGEAYDLLSKDKWLAEYENERLERMRELSKSSE